MSCLCTKYQAYFCADDCWSTQATCSFACLQTWRLAAGIVFRGADSNLDKHPLNDLVALLWMLLDFLGSEAAHHGSRKDSTLLTLATCHHQTREMFCSLPGLLQGYNKILRSGFALKTPLFPFIIWRMVALRTASRRRVRRPLGSRTPRPLAGSPGTGREPPA